MDETQLRFEKEYKQWKLKNVSLRGLKDTDNENNKEGNGNYGSYGKGLYTAFKTNKSLASQYGQVHFVVGAIPQMPKKFQYAYQAEVYIYQEVLKLGYDKISSFLSDGHGFEEIFLRNGYDGLIIQSREYCHYKPENILYFKDETQLKNYFYSTIFKK